MNKTKRRQSRDHGRQGEEGLLFWDFFCLFWTQDFSFQLNNFIPRLLKYLYKVFLEVQLVYHLRGDFVFSLCQSLCKSGDMM